MQFINIALWCVPCVLAMAALPFGSAFSLNLNKGQVVAQLGGFRSTQGEAQFVGINGSVGNTYTVTQYHDINVLLGLGYYFKGPQLKTFHFTYGMNAFYFPDTYVKGKVIQEGLFTNLDYRYSISHLPILAVGQMAINNNTNTYAVTTNIGIGPNVTTTSRYSEHARDNGVTLPDNAFSGSKALLLGVMAGIGTEIKHVFGPAPLTCGYYFFYFGQSQLRRNTNELLSPLKTGQSYANALICSVSF